MTRKIINSPLRYPGGKAKLYPEIQRIISNNYQGAPVYAEPYSGGFGIGINLLNNKEASLVLINDYDYCIYCFWKSITSPNIYFKFVDKLKKTKINIENWNIQKQIYLDYKKHSILDVGFATFYLNRTNRSGIILANPIGGIKQNGKYKMDCRFNKENLLKTIAFIYENRKRIIVSNEDGFYFAKRIDTEYKNILIYFDPPYVKAGPMLYKRFYDSEKHVELSKTISKLKCKWVLTYDDSELIKKLYKKYRKNTYIIRYCADKNRLDNEIMIYSKNMIMK